MDGSCGLSDMFLYVWISHVGYGPLYRVIGLCWLMNTPKRMDNRVFLCEKPSKLVHWMFSLDNEILQRCLMVMLCYTRLPMSMAEWRFRLPPPGELHWPFFLFSYQEKDLLGKGFLLVIMFLFEILLRVLSSASKCHGAHQQVVIWWLLFCVFHLVLDVLLFVGVAGLLHIIACSMYQNKCVLHVDNF